MRIPWGSAPLRIAAAIAAAAGAGWLAARSGRNWAARQPPDPAARERERRDALVQEASEESFPASDPPSYTHESVGSPERRTE